VILVGSENGNTYTVNRETEKYNLEDELGEGMRPLPKGVGIVSECLETMQGLFEESFIPTKDFYLEMDNQASMDVINQLIILPVRSEYLS
jgi:hypothetical protein